MGNWMSMTRSWIRAKASLPVKEELGGGEIIAVVVVIAIVIVLGVLFQEQITTLFGTLWEKVTGASDGIQQSVSI